MQVLSLEPVILDMDPKKLLDHMSTKEKERRFGVPANPEKITAYLEYCSSKLSDIIKTLIFNINKALPSFPSAIAWVLSRMYVSAQTCGQSSQQAFTICYELLANQIFFPALTQPERFGICPEHVSITKLHSRNLQIITVVLQELIHLYDENNMSFRINTNNLVGANSIYTVDNASQLRTVVNDIITTSTGPSDESHHKNNPHLTGSMSSSLTKKGELPTVNSILTSYSNDLFLITPIELSQIIMFLFKIKDSNLSGVDQNSLNEILNQLPPESLTICLAGSATGIQNETHNTSFRTLSPEGNRSFQNIKEYSENLNFSMRSSRSASFSNSGSPTNDRINPTNLFSDLKRNLKKDYAAFENETKKNFQGMMKDLGEGLKSINFKDGASSPLAGSRSPVNEKNSAEQIVEKSEEKMTHEIVLTFGSIDPKETVKQLNIKVADEQELIEIEKEKHKERSEAQKKHAKGKNRYRSTTPGTEIYTTGAPAAGSMLFGRNAIHNEPPTSLGLGPGRNSTQASMSSHKDVAEAGHNSVRFSIISSGLSDKEKNDPENENNDFDDQTDGNESAHHRDQIDEHSYPPGSSYVNDGSQTGTNDEVESNPESCDNNANEDDEPISMGPPLTHQAAGPDPLKNMNNIEEETHIDNQRPQSPTDSLDHEDADDADRVSIPQRNNSSQGAAHLKQLEVKVGTSAETIEQRWRKNDIPSAGDRKKANLGEAPSVSNWSTDALAESDHENAGANEYGRTLGEIAEENSSDVLKPRVQTCTPKSSLPLRNPNGQPSRPASNSGLQVLSHAFGPNDGLPAHIPGDSRSDIWSVEVSPSDNDSTVDETPHSNAYLQRRLPSENQRRLEPNKSDSNQPISDPVSPSKLATNNHFNSIPSLTKPTNLDANYKLDDLLVNCSSGGTMSSNGSLNREDPSETGNLTRDNSKSREKSSLLHDPNLNSQPNTPNATILDMFDPLKQQSQSSFTPVNKIPDIHTQESFSLGVNIGSSGETKKEENSTQQNISSPNIPVRTSSIPKKEQGDHGAPYKSSLKSLSSSRQSPSILTKNENYPFPSSGHGAVIIVNPHASHSLSHKESNSPHHKPVDKKDPIPEAVRRLRSILSSVDAARPASAIDRDFNNSTFHNMDIFTSFGGDMNNFPVHRDVRQQIVNFLQDQLSVALAIHNSNAIVQIQETMKMIENITPRQCLKVVKTLLGKILDHFLTLILSFFALGDCLLKSFFSMGRYSTLRVNVLRLLSQNKTKFTRSFMLFRQRLKIYFHGQTFNRHRSNPCLHHEFLQPK